MDGFCRQVITVIELKIHEYFKHLSSSDNDIALLMLKVKHKKT